METNKSEFFTEWEESFDAFDQMGLHENLLRGIYAYGEGASALGGGAAARPAGRPRRLQTRAVVRAWTFLVPLLPRRRV